MMLTKAQADSIMKDLDGKVSSETLSLIKSLVKKNTEDNTLNDGDSYTDIRGYSKLLYDKLVQIGTGVVVTQPGDETLMVYMEPKKVRRLLNNVPDDGYLAALPGIHTRNGISELTVSLLAIDNNMQPMPEHVAGNLPGEECWDNRSLMKQMNAALPPVI